MARLAIFVDGAYLERLAREEFKAKIDYRRLSAEITARVAERTAEPLDLLRTLYYNSLPYQGRQPSPDEARRYGAQRRFFDALRNLERFEVREGRASRMGLNQDGQPIFQQKGVDMLLGIDFALWSVKGKITHAAVVTGDSDFTPAFQLARSEGISVWLVHGPRRSRMDGSPTYAVELYAEADERVEIDEEFVKRVRRLAQVPPAAGPAGI